MIIDSKVVIDELEALKKYLNNEKVITQHGRPLIKTDRFVHFNNLVNIMHSETDNKRLLKRLDMNNNMLSEGYEKRRLDIGDIVVDREGYIGKIEYIRKDTGQVTVRRNRVYTTYDYAWMLIKIQTTNVIEKESL